ncbi:uncharacterized protein LOC130555224 [Triplophysa rosa]|uniref:uncharacterized protein LOC130555224 n=1 Tax=Triplophysa rosa TaxID=992332 RepID=UPI0025461CCD|nr:uncharacterized protein LOC130555224 [Triplophysa rosa]
MDIKYALVDFFTYNTIHICELSQLKHRDMTKLNPNAIHKWDKNEEAYIFWKKSSSDELQRWPCRVIQFSGERQPLIDTRKIFEKGCAFDRIPLFAKEESLGKGRREKVKRNFPDVGETSFLDQENAPVTAKKKKTKNSIQQKIMAAVKESCSQIVEPRAVRGQEESFSSSPLSPKPCESSDKAEKIKELKDEIKELQEDLKYERRFRIKAERELREWKEIHAVVQELKCTVGEMKVMCTSKKKPDIMHMPSSSEDTAGQNQEPRIAQESGQVTDYINLGEGVTIKRSQFERINTQDFKKFTSELLLVTFGRETLATHSLNGRKAPNADTSKEALPANKVSVLIGYIQKRFRVSTSEIKAVIRTKLNNEDKLLKKRNLSE